MEKQFVSYEISKELKKLGFDEECLACYRGGSLYQCGSGGYHEDWNYHKSYGEGNQWISAPLLQQVIDWFVEKHNIWIVVDTSPIKFYEDEELQPVKYQFIIEDIKDRDGDYLFHSADADLFYLDYKEARVQAILSAIEILKNK